MKAQLTILLINLGFAAAAFGADNPCCPKPCTPVCCPAIVEDCCSFTECPPTNQVTPNAGPRVKNGWDFYGVAAFTYWTAHEDGLAFATIQADLTIGTFVPETQIAIPDFDWKPGFKVGAGMDFCHDGWDIFLNYTWFHSMNNTRSIAVDPAGNPDVVDSYWLVNLPFFTDVSPVNLLEFYESSFGKWGVRLNVFDLELGRNFYMSRRLQFRPYFGLKGMWERQNLFVNFNSFLANGTELEYSQMNNNLKNWGIGIRAGFDTAWHFTNSFSLLGEFALTGLWEQFKVHRVDSSTIFAASTLTGPGNVSGVNHTSNYYNLKPVIEWFLGFRWETWTCGQGYHFALDAGWEQQIWFGQNQFLRIDDLDADHGDLGLQGLTARFRFDF